MKDAKTKYTLLGLLVILIWATSSTMVKQMVIFSNNNYLTDIVVYNALAFFVLLPIVIKKGEFKALKDKRVLKALIPAVLCNGFYDLFVTSAEGMSVRIQYAQIGNYMWPMLIVLLLGIKKKNPSKAGIFSTLVGFLAVLVLFIPEVIGGGTMNSKDVWALLLGVVAAFLWANYSVILSTHEELNSSVYLIPALGQGVSSLVMFIFASSCGKFNLVDIANTPALTCIVIYAIIGMSLSYVLWAFVMTKHPALENFSVLSYLTPVLSLLIATLYFRGTFNIQILIAGILIVIAIYISKLEDKKKQNETNKTNRVSYNKHIKTKKQTPMVHQLNLNFNEALEPRTTTDYIILHHSGVKKRHTAHDIHQWHKNKGWAGIGYHYFISKEGIIYECRQRDTIGAHAKGYNDNSIGVCFEGDFNKESMTDAQCSDEVIRFLFFLGLTYPDSQIVFCDELKQHPVPTIKGFRKDELWKQYDIFYDGFHSERARVWGEEWAQTFYDWWDSQLMDFGLYEPDEDDF